MITPKGLGGNWQPEEELLGTPSPDLQAAC
jgi:hypothetical protein